MVVIKVFGIAISLACLIYGFIRFVENRKKGKDIYPGRFLLYLAFPLIQVTLFYFLSTSESDFSTFQIGKLFIGMIVCAAGDYFLAEFIFDSHSRKQIEKETIDMRYKLELSDEVHKLSKERNEVLLREKDEYLTAIDNLFKHQKLDSLSSNQKKYTSNVVLNYLLENKVNEAKALNIDTFVDIDIPQNIKIDSLAIASIVMNIWDNAINACRVYSGNRKIIFTAYPQGNILFINLKNSADSASQRADKSRKHYGQEIIQKYVEKYNGFANYSFQKKESLYEVNLMIQEESHDMA